MGKLINKIRDGKPLAVDSLSGSVYLLCSRGVSIWAAWSPLYSFILTPQQIYIHSHNIQIS